jgi:hypothetical protein
MRQTCTGPDVWHLPTCYSLRRSAWTLLALLMGYPALAALQRELGKLPSAAEDGATAAAAGGKKRR